MPLALRFANLPKRGLPLREKVLVHWDEHQIPFIEAMNDEDLAVSLGLLHVHLRWTQMEVMRRIGQGRVSEMMGPLGTEIDRALRTLDIPRAVPEILAQLPEDTRRWLESFCAGVNHAVTHIPAEPPDFPMLGLTREPWQVADILGLARLVSADVSWAVWIALLGHRDSGLALSLWRRIAGARDGTDPASFDSGRGGPPTIAALIRRFGRPGSNSFALGPERSRSKAAWLASDPHLAATLPNPWLIAGYKSPSYHVVGLMTPGLPAVLLGRNPWIAWGGTSLHAASSDIIDVSDLRPGEIRSSRTRIRARWWRAKEVSIRDTDYGPVLSDLPSLRWGNGRAYALRWVGHMPSDEITAMLRVNRAHDWQGFKDALTGFAVPAQTFIFADGKGHIGKAMAGRLPRRRRNIPDEPVLARNLARHWDDLAHAGHLPSTLDPESRFVASANERPDDAPFPIGYFFSSRDRVERMGALLGSAWELEFDDVAAVQQDVFSASSAALRDKLLGLYRSLPASPARPPPPLLRCLEAWDGCYRADSAGALAFEILLFHFAASLLGRERIALYAMTWDPRALLRADIEAAPPQAVRSALRRALRRASAQFREGEVWGAFHRLGLPHVLGLVPFWGTRFRFGDWAAGGSGETLMKTAHPLTPKRHFARLAATARHISDLADPDRNYFVLLGGQDGWLGSTTLLDQVPLWRRGDYVTLPMRPETIRDRFRFQTELVPHD